MLDAGRLATLRSVVALGSFSAAAESLSLTQPVVSRQVALLERQVGLQLVERTRRGVRPTEAGRLLLEHADIVLRQLARAEEELAELAGLRRGRVRLGSFFAALGRLSTELAADLGERHPEVVIEDELVDRPGGGAPGGGEGGGAGGRGGALRRREGRAAGRGARRRARGRAAPGAAG